MNRSPFDSAAPDKGSAAPTVSQDSLSLKPSETLLSLPSGSIGRQVFWLALPMLGEQFFTFLVQLVDTWLAGHLNKEAQAAVGTGAYMSWFVGLIVSLIGTGAAALVSRSIGARDPNTANRAANQALLLGVALGIAACAVAELIAPWLSAALGQTQETRNNLLTFMRIDALGYVPHCVALICSGVMRAAGDTRTPMKVQIGVNIINAALASTFVFLWPGPEFGVAGIACSTLVARTFGGIAMLTTLSRGVQGVQIQPRRASPDSEMIRRMLRIGLPAAADALMMATAQMMFLYVIFHSAEKEQATVNAATHMIAMRVEALSYLLAMAWMTAAATLVGQYLGAKRTDLAAKAGHVAALQTACFCSLIGALFVFCAPLIFQTMSNDPQVQAVGSRAFPYMGLVQPLLGMAIVYIGALRGAGDTRTTMMFSLIGSIGLRVPVAYLGAVVFGGGLLGAWLGMWADNLVKFGLSLARFSSGKWKKLIV